MAQAVSHRLLVTEAQLHARTVHVGFVVNKVALREVSLHGDEQKAC
jgi:hypothetical protein